MTLGARRAMNHRSEPAAADAAKSSRNEKRKRAEMERQRALDEALELGLEDTFPASDPVAVTQPQASPWGKQEP
jgi:hypothetical protein